MIPSPVSAAVLALMTLSGVNPASPQDQVQAGEGVICLWAISSLVAEVGQRCAPDRNPEAQDALRQSVRRIDAYVRANSDITDEQFAQFKREQARVGAPEAELCHGDPMQMFESMATDEAAGQIREQTDRILAQPGKPTWGTCL